MEDGGRVTTVGREVEIDEGGGSWNREKRREKNLTKRDGKLSQRKEQEQKLGGSNLDLWP